MIRCLALGIALMVCLAGCGGDTFSTATPSFARFKANDILHEFKNAGLRVDGAQDQSTGTFVAPPPRFTEAKSFACGNLGGKSTATVFTFDSPTDLTAMEKFLQEKYAKRYRALGHMNALVVFWGSDTSDTLKYDAILLSMK